MKGIAVGQKGFEKLLCEELELLRGITKTKVESTAVYFAQGKVTKSVFAHFFANNTTALESDTVNGIAGEIFDYFINTTKDVKFTDSFPVVFWDSQKENGLARRAKSIKEAFFSILKKRMSRVSKLAVDDYPEKVGDYTGLFVFVDDFNRVSVAKNFHYNGQKRMADDPLAPSRSYLKVEEGYRVLGYSPIENSLVVDLGAAPGGWSYSAARRGATVFAIDNGPLKKGALESEMIIHEKADAFKYKPKEKIDWLFCDLVEQPNHVMQLIKEWLENKRCHSFVINFKFGHVNPVELIRELENNQHGLVRYTSRHAFVHLYHDRDEITFVGSV